MSRVAAARVDSHHLVTLAELVQILGDDCSVQYIHTDGNYFDNPMFGKATQQAVNEFVDATIVAVDHGLFRP